MKITICLVFGLPGVGKSTICRCLLDSTDTNNHNWKFYHKCLFSFDKLMPGDIKFDEVVDNSKNGVTKDDSKAVTRDGSSAIIQDGSSAIIQDGSSAVTQDGSSAITQDGSSAAGGGGGLWKQYRENVIKIIESSIKKLSNSSDQSDNDNNSLDSVSEENVNSTEENNKTACIAGATPVARDMCSCFQNGIVISCCDDNKNNSNTHHVLFIDDNLFYRSMRYRFYQMARHYSCSFCQVYIHAPIDTVIGRNDGRPENAIIPRATILKMNNIFEVPDHQEFQWEMNTLEINNMDELISSTCDAGYKVSSRQKILDKIIGFVVESSTEIVPPLLSKEEIEKRELSRLVNLNNYIHRCDQLLRRFISTQMQAAKSSSARSSQSGSDCCDEGVKGVSVSEDVSNRKGVSNSNGVNISGNKMELKAVAKHMNSSRKKYLEYLRTSCDSISTWHHFNHDSSGDSDCWSEREIAKFERFLNIDNLT